MCTCAARLAHSRLVALVCEGRNSCFVNDRVQQLQRNYNNYNNNVGNGDGNSWRKKYGWAGGAISGARSRLLNPCYMSSPINCNRTGHTKKKKKYLLAWQILKEFLESANVRSECQNARMPEEETAQVDTLQSTKFKANFAVVCFFSCFLCFFLFLAVLTVFVFALDVVKVSLCVFSLFFFYRVDVDSHSVFSRNFVWNISIYVSVCKFSYLYLAQLYLPQRGFMWASRTPRQNISELCRVEFKAL